MNRRSFLMSTVAVTGSVTLAGCSGGSGGGGASPPAEDADTQELLPEPPEGWEKVAEQQQMASAVGAEGGYAADYTGPDGGEYRVEILRWPSASDAESESMELYAESKVVLTQNNFTFVGKGPDINNIITLLSASQSLTEDYIEENNMT